MLKINKLIYIIFLIGVFLSPFVTFLPLGMNISMYDALLIISFGLIILVILLSPKRKLDIKMVFPFILLIVFSLGALISSFNANNWLSSFFILSQYIFAITVQIIVINHIFKHAINIEKVLFNILDVLFYSTFFILFLNLLAFLGILPFSGSFFTGNNRLESVMGNPNIVAKYLAFILPVLLVYIELKRKVFQTYISLTLLILSLFLTASFSGIIYLSIAFLYFYIVKILFISRPVRMINGNIHILKKFMNIRSIVFTLFIATTVSFLAFNPPEIFIDRVLSADDISEAGSASLRIDLISEALALIFTDYFFIGAGLGEYPIISQYFTNVHNLYLLVFSETGVIGFVGLIGLVLYTFVFSLKIFLRTSGHRKIIMLGLNASVFVFMIIIAASTHQYDRRSWLLLILTLCVSHYFNKKQE